MTVLATHALTAGWASFGQVLESGLAFDALRLGNLDTQTDVKNRWLDGSIKFTKVTALIPADGDYQLEPFSPPSDPAPFPSTPQPAFWLALKVGTTWYSAGYSAINADDSRWLDGPLVRERRSYLPFFTNTGATHPFLRCVLDVREHRDGTWRFDCCVENCLKTAGYDLPYSVYAGVDSSTVLWSKVNFTHIAGSRWRKVFTLKERASPRLGLDFAALEPSASSSLTEEMVHERTRAHKTRLAAVPMDPPSHMMPDLTQHIAAKAIPDYSANVVNWVYAPEGWNFEVGGTADLNPRMESHSGREELGPYPDWTARYLVHRDPIQRAYVLANGDLAGSWPVHVRKVDGGFVTVDEFPDFWMDDRWREEGLDGPVWYLSSVITPDVNHQPSLAYVPYILTGDRFYADELADWANYCLLWAYRRGSEGLLFSIEPRGVGWGIARLAEAAGWLPDDDPRKAYFAEKLTNNLKQIDWMTDDPAGYNVIGAYGTMWMGVSNPPEDYVGPWQWTKDWQHDTVCWAVDLANQFGFSDGTRFRDAHCRFRIGWLNDPIYGIGAAPYGLVVQLRAGGPGLTQYWEAFGYGGGPSQFAGFYGANNWITAQVGRRNGIPGSQEALEFLLAVEAEMPDSLARTSGWYEAL